MQRDSVTDPQSNNYKWFVLAILTVVYAFNFIDRQILVILQEPIKAELGLSDTQLGLLTGFSFAVVYVTAGIPIAWLADRSNRRNIVAVSLGIWSVMTALSGIVQNYTQLLLARLGVGLGEAGGSPPSHSMLSDYFPEEQRGTALNLYHGHLSRHLFWLLCRWLDRGHLRLAQCIFYRRYPRRSLGFSSVVACAGTAQNRAAQCS